MTFDAITTLFPWLLPAGTFFLAIFLLLLLVVVVSAMQNRQYLRQKEALQSYVFPQTYMDDVKLRYPHLTEADLAIAFEELRSYFYLCWKKQPKTVVMPSRLVDVCWHVFITDTHHYQQFSEDVYVVMAGLLVEDVVGLRSSLQISTKCPSRSAGIHHCFRHLLDNRHKKRTWQIAKSLI